MTTTSVNLRAGPGTNFASIRTLPAGTAVDIGDCDTAGSWCAVTLKGQRGFVSGRYLQESEDPDGWPRSYEVGKGRIILYQPQFTEWTDFKTIEALVAAEFAKAPDAQPVFGVIGLKGTTSHDEDAGEIVISDITVTELNFSSLGRDDLTALAVETGKLLPTGPITVSEARVTASLAEQKRMSDVTGLKADAPPIFVSTSPGDPGSDRRPGGLCARQGQRPVSPFWSIPTGTSSGSTTGGALYLRHDTHWLSARAIEGPWTPVAELPALLMELPDDGSWDDARAAVRPEPYPDGAAPKIIHTNAPAEMLLFDGEPALEDVPGTSLQWASNSESDVFFDKVGKQWYVLLSGRWFRAPALSGPWTFATPDLPADFRNIPEGAPYYAVRSSVPGTSESAEARLKASIPTTARVEAGSITPTVAYTRRRAVRPDRGDGSRLCDEHERDRDQGRCASISCFRTASGSWPTARTARGSSPARSPRRSTRSRPRRRSTTPPTCACTRPSPTRSGTATRWDTCSASRPGVPTSTAPDGPIRRTGTPGRVTPTRSTTRGPLTWGLGAYYNPVRGVFGRYGYAYGPYRGIAGVRSWNPRTGTYVRGGAAWGPRGSAGFVGAYNPRSDKAGYIAGGRNVYGAWKSAGVKRGSEWARVTARSNVAGGSTLRWNTSAGQGFVHEGRRGDIYAGRDGNVYRNTGDGWQTFEGGWQDVARPERGELLERGEGLRDLSPEARDRLQERGGGEALRGLAGAGAAGAAGAALGQRLSGGEQARGTAPKAAALVNGGKSGRLNGHQHRSAPRHRSARPRRSEPRRHSGRRRRSGHQRSNVRRHRRARPRRARLRPVRCHPISVVMHRLAISGTNARSRAGSSIGPHRSSRVRRHLHPSGAWLRGAALKVAALAVAALEEGAAALVAVEAAAAEPGQHSKLDCCRILDLIRRTVSGRVHSNQIERMASGSAMPSSPAPPAHRSRGCGA